MSEKWNVGAGEFPLHFQIKIIHQIKNIINLSFFRKNQVFSGKNQRFEDRLGD
jgi:hypothetical protein